MGMMFSYGCDAHGKLQDRWDSVDVNSSTTIDGGKFGAGTDSMRLIDDNDSNTTKITRAHTIGSGLTGNPLHFSFYVKTSDVSTVNEVMVKFFESTGADGALLLYSSTGTLFLTQLESLPSQNSPPAIPGSSPSIADGTWHHVEVKYVAHATLGIAKLWLDSTLEIDFSGDTIQSGSVTSFTDILFGGVQDGNDTEYDDILVWDEEGSTMNSAGPLSPHRIETLIPDGDGNSTQFTPTGAGATNSDRIDEEGSDGDTTYVESGTATNKDLYTYTSLAGSVGVIEGVFVHTVLKNPDIGSQSAKIVTRSNVTESSGTNFAVSGADIYATHSEFVTLDPNTAAEWTEVGLNAAEFGIEVV